MTEDRPPKSNRILATEMANRALIELSNRSEEGAILATAGALLAIHYDLERLIGLLRDWPTKNG